MEPVLDLNKPNLEDNNISSQWFLQPDMFILVNALPNKYQCNMNNYIDKLRKL